MSDRGSFGALAVSAALATIVAALIVGMVMLRNWLAYEVVYEAIKQPANAFPTSQVHFPLWSTPWAVSTPLFDPSMWNYQYSTPTPRRADVIIITR